MLTNTWGPSMLRRLDVELNGYAYCRRSSNPVLRDHKSLFYKRQCGMLWTLLAAMERFAQNGIVRRRARQTDKRYRALVGEPTAVMAMLSDVVVRLAGKDYARLALDPAHYRPKEEPFKRYVYEKGSDTDGPLPYRTEWPGRPRREIRRARRGESLRYLVLEEALKARRLTARGRTDRIIDDYLIGMVSDRAFGFGL